MVQISRPSLGSLDLVLPQPQHRSRPLTLAPTPGPSYAHGLFLVFLPFCLRSLGYLQETGTESHCPEHAQLLKRGDQF